MPFYIDGVALDELTSDPGTPEEGQFWYNTTDSRFKGYVNGSIEEIAHISDLEAGSIVVNASGFTGILSSLNPGPTDVQTALDVIDQRIFTGSSTPVSTTDGVLWYNTTAGWETLMAYDSSRTKWLSVAEWTLEFGHDTASNQLTRGFGVNTPAAGTGVLIPRNACIKRISARTISDNVLKQLQVYVNGASALSFTLVDATNSSIYNNNAVNLNLNENDYVWIWVTGTPIAAINDFAVCLWCSWRV